MRILLVSSAYWPYPSGISEHVYHLAKHLTSRGHQVKILTTNYPSNWEDTPDDNLEIIRLGRVILIPVNKSYATFPFGFDIPFKVKKLLQEEQYDIIHVHGCYPPEIGFWAICFSNTINCVTFHTVGFKKTNYIKHLGILLKRYQEKIHGRIAVSEIARTWAEPLFPGEYRIIPNGVDYERFSTKVVPLIAKDNNSFTILYLGRLDQRKGVLIAINAFAKIKTLLPNAKLLIAGKGPLEQTAKALVKRLNLEKYCQFLGYIKKQDLVACYKSADVFISPALGGEAQGIVLLEAMAADCVVIASDIEGYQEVIEHGKTGLLFKTGAADDLADKLWTIATNNELRNFLIRNSQLQIKKYSWQNIVQQIENYYKELIARD